jgi:hypothetical protein
VFAIDRVVAATGPKLFLDQIVADIGQAYGPGASGGAGTGSGAASTRDHWHGLGDAERAAIPFCHHLWAELVAAAS